MTTIKLSIDELAIIELALRDRIALLTKESNEHESKTVRNIATIQLGENLQMYDRVRKIQRNN